MKSDKVREIMDKFFTSNSIEEIEEERERFAVESGGTLIPIFLGLRAQVVMVFYNGEYSNGVLAPIGSLELDLEDDLVRAFPLMNMDRHFPDFFKDFPSDESTKAMLWLKNEFEEQITEYRKQAMEAVVKDLSNGSPEQDSMMRSILKKTEQESPGFAAHVAKRRATEEIRKVKEQLAKKRAKKASKSNGEIKDSVGNTLASPDVMLARGVPVTPYVALLLFDREDESEDKPEPRLEIVNPVDIELPDEYPTDDQKWIAEQIQEFQMFHVNLSDERSLGRDYIKPYRYNGPVYEKARDDLWRLLSPGFTVVLESPDSGIHDVPPEEHAVLVGEIVDEYLRTLRQFWVYPNKSINSQE